VSYNVGVEGALTKD